MTKKEETKAVKEIMKSLREEILEADDLPTREVKVPEWTDKPLYVRSLNAIERDDFALSLLEEDAEGNQISNRRNVRGKILAMTLCSDKEGKKRIFKNDDAEALGNKSSKALDKCINEAELLAGISSKEAKEVVKN